MKIAVIMNWSRPHSFLSNKAGGMMSAAKNLADEIGADLIYLKKTERIKRGDGDSHHFIFLSADEFINRNYDFAIFTTPGCSDQVYHPESGKASEMTVIVPALDAFPPFGVWTHDEAESCLPPLLLGHRKCKLRMAITKEIGERNLGGAPFTVYPGYTKNIQLGGAMARKGKVISMTCRMTSRKTVIPFLKEAAPAFIADGFRVIIAGVEASYFYAKAAREAAKAVGAEYLGAVESLAAIQSESRFNANLPYLKNGSFVPRIELSTIESAMRGAVPIVLDETTPKDVRGVIRVPRHELSSMYSLTHGIDREGMVGEFIAFHNRKWADLPQRLLAEIRKAVK